MHTLIPAPSSFSPLQGQFTLAPNAHIGVSSEPLLPLGEFLAACLRPATGFSLPVEVSGEGDICLALGSDPTLEREGYRLEVQPDRVVLVAAQPAGIFNAIQTLRQLLPPAVEARTRQPGPWTVRACSIRDLPRYAWRGAMLDVARHFFGVEEVKRLIDQCALHKLNVLHLHLSDDQGWRLEIQSWPRLAEVGGSTATNGDPGGYYTQAQYREIVDYAASRFITVIPEIDMPSHTQAAIASYPELKGISKASGLYTGTEVGFCTLNIHEEITYKFLEDVLGEVAALTPAPYLHIGGDEAHSTPEADYKVFIERVQGIVRGLGKVCLGWEEIGKAELLPDTVVQYWWQGGHALKAARAGNKLIASPAKQVYLDIKYDASTRLGQDWTQKYVEVRDAYDWDPATCLEGVPAESVIGVEAPLWTETIVTRDDLDYMFFPRLCAAAEAAWTPQEGRLWDDFRNRLAAHGPRLEALGVKFHRSPQIDWQTK